MHERLHQYYEARKRIFGTQSTVVSEKVSRLRKKFQEKKKAYRAIEATTLCCSDDPRPYANVTIFGEPVLGLLDSGASISCLGLGGQEFLQKHGLNSSKLSSKVKTADGNQQSIVGKFYAEICYKGMTKTMPLYLVPSLQQKLYLGIDFWKEFGIAPQLISEVSTVQCPVEKDVDPNAHELTSEQSKRLKDAIDLFPSSAVQGLGKTSLEVHTIDTGDAEPIKQRHYPVSPAVQKLLYEELERMLKLGVIEESSSAWSSPVVLVRKPGKNRLCLDYRKVNSKTKKDAYPISHIGGLLSRLQDTRFISSVDLKDAFWQIPLEKESREKTAFTVPGMPLLQFTVMPFGLCNAPQRMVRLMDKVVPHQLREKIFPYLDDLLVVSSTFDEHVELLKILAGRLKEAGLTMNVQKSKFCFKELKYLGYIVGDGCLKTDSDKVAAIADFPVPTSAKQVRRFLGLAGWYRRFVRDFSTLAAPITDTLKKGKKFQFGEAAMESFNLLKDALTSQPVLVNPDFAKEFIIQCDASDTGVGCVLSQVDESGSERPIYYHSQKLNTAQRNYSVTERECLAAVMGVQKFRAYVEGHPFRIVTDHASLKWLMGQKDLSGRLARWSLKLQGFDFSIEHRKGTQNVVPDALSRVHEVDALGCDVSVLEDPHDVLHIDLEDPSFQSSEYLRIIKDIEEQKEKLPDLQVSESFVYKKVKHCTGNPLEDDLVWKLWVPEQLTDRLISLAHRPPRASHGGIAKTLYRLQQRFFWPNMAAQVRAFLEKCDICKASKAPNSTLRPPMGKAFVAERPFQMLYIDFLGPYPRSRDGNTHIVVVLDQLTKFVLIKAIRRATTDIVLKFLYEQVFCMFGVPETLLSDNGKQFISREFEKTMDTYGITHVRTAVYSPQANASERVNRSILAAIRGYIDSDQRNWDSQLPAIASALRTTVHSAINMSPYEALFGQGCLEHGADYAVLRRLKGLNNSGITIIPKMAKMNILHDHIKASLANAHSRYETAYNLRSKSVKFNVGDIVFRRNFVLSDASKKFCAKLSPKFLKMRVRRSVGNNLYELEDLTGKKAGVYHAKDLKK